MPATMAQEGVHEAHDTMRLHWHRQDLRLADNRGLSEPPDTPIGLVVFDDEQIARMSPSQFAFMHAAIEALQGAYQLHGSILRIERGDPTTIVPEVARALEVDVVSWNHSYTPRGKATAEQVKDQLAEASRTPQAIHDALCHPPGTITTNDGTHYSVYSYFWRKWRDREKAEPVSPPTLAPSTEIDTLPPYDIFDKPEPNASIPEASTSAARDKFESFIESDIRRYDDARDFPAQQATSGLSPHLAMGTIGIREIDKRLRELLAAAEGGARESIETFRSQLAWREFYAHVLEFNPQVVEENFRSYTHAIEWENDDTLLNAWKAGKTGYPIVDAGMRQLKTEGLMHNRVRMIVASFLTKDLLIDWRYGAEHFRTNLMDHDLANNNGGWQWAASTGTDAQPYFRIFNPMTQGERYDENAEYIKTYVPELADAEPEIIHSWHECSPTQREQTAPAYPAPIIDHATRRERALEMFKRARGEEDQA